jgi:hypothetical protein
LKEKQAALEK